MIDLERRPRGLAARPPPRADRAARRGARAASCSWAAASARRPTPSGPSGRREPGADRVAGCLRSALVGELARPPARWRWPPTASTAASARTAGSVTPRGHGGVHGAAGAAGVADFLVTAIGRDGTGLGPDTGLLAEVRPLVPGVLIAAGGVGSAAHVRDAVDAGADAVVVAAGAHGRRPHGEPGARRSRSRHHPDGGLPSPVCGVWVKKDGRGSDPPG